MLAVRRWAAFDKLPSLIQFAQTWHGKLTLIGVMTFALIIYHQIGLTWWPIIALPGQYQGMLRWPFVSCAIIATSFLPQYRRIIVSLMSIIGLAILPWFQWDTLASHQTIDHRLILACIFLSIGLYIAVVKYFEIKKPVALLLLLTFALIIIASYTNAYNLWAGLIAFSALIWFVSYSLTSLRSTQLKSSSQGALQKLSLRGALRRGNPSFFFYLPFWGSTTTPLPKGGQYLNHIEAKDAEAFARLNTNHPYPWYWAWIAVLEQFGFELCAIGMYGHLVIGLCRMTGFHAQRNMDSPLTATTIVAFWNRYYFYFKELLVEFFFYPTYFRYFKKHPRLRIFFATMIAACVGNIIFHLLAEPKYLIEYGLWGALKRLQVYLFYAIILGLAISISQLRKMKQKTATHPLQRYFLAPITVIGFYCIMTVFNRPYQSLDLKQNLLFLASMFNL